MPISRFRLYEESVQSPRWQVDYLPQFHEWITGRRPLRFREDFCGSARIACEWVKKDPSHRAWGLDIDPEALRYARETHLPELSLSQRKHIHLLRKNVLNPGSMKVDWIGAFNYSIFTFHERRNLLKYLRSARGSLAPGGTLFLEVAGGPGFLSPGMERRKIRISGTGTITQLWEQGEYDPASGANRYALHFQLPDRSWMQNAFVYHWRIWSLSEIKDALMDAGFKKSILLMEKDPDSPEPSNEYLPVESAPHADFFVAYVIGVR